MLYKRAEYAVLDAGELEAVIDDETRGFFRHDTLLVIGVGLR